MKWRLIVGVFAIAVLYACNSGNEENQGDSGGKNGKKSERNLSITPANAYSDLFLDSSEVERFINEQKVSEEQAEDLRRFYNFRNFQFAWFSTDGVTEQTLSFRS